MQYSILVSIFMLQTVIFLYNAVASSVEAFAAAG